MMGNYDMAAERKFRFSLSTVLLFTVIVALAVSHWVQMRKVRQAQAQLKAALSEVASVRKQFGHLEIGDPKLIYVGWIESRSNSLRVQIPPGHRFLMHVTEMGFPPAGWPENPEPTTSMSMNSWSEGADVFLQWRFLREGKNRRFIGQNRFGAVVRLYNGELGGRPVAKFIGTYCALSRTTKVFSTPRNNSADVIQE
jgi:hypothetical protein